MTENIKQRAALSVYFLLSGFCFASWASRIPTIKMIYDLNDAELGNLLLILPISSLLSLPISGWLVSKFDSRLPLIVSFSLFSIALALIGLSNSLWILSIALFLFAFNMRIINISINTQSLTVQKGFPKKIIGSFHGIWSGGGLLGVGFSTLMVKTDVLVATHLMSVGLFSLVISFIAYPFLLKNDKSPHGNKLILGKPDKTIMLLGLIIFFAAVCEGGMFDWSGVYFKEVVKEEIFTLGYLIFILFMTLSRFFSDKLMDYIGMKKLYILSSVFISSGILTAIIFPYFWPALIGFSIVGIGVAAIFPMTYMLAGTSKKYSPGMAISIITTYAIAGMLVGPPLLGYIAHTFNLKMSFLLFVFSGLMFIPISQLFFKLKEEQSEGKQGL
ncbi:MFS transporter [Mariniflexile ostreae]|uniref:MFS transporter n=1 Tax=Mariniflexile ostreae TaxID=1520892 RepID=A0ABV5FFH9_9FLAO